MKARSGVALLVALLVLVVVELMTASLVALGTQARVVADANTRSLRAQIVAENGVARVLNTFDQLGVDTISIGSSVAVAAGRSAVDESAVTSVERLAATSYLVDTEARIGSPLTYALARASAYARLLDRGAVLAESNAAVTAAGGVELGGSGRIAGTADDTCGSDLGLGGHLDFSGTNTPTTSRALGGATWQQISQMTRRPVTDGFPVIYSDTAVTLSATAMEAILVVKASVRLTGDITFAGLIVAAGDIDVSAGVTIYGAVRSGGRVRITDAIVAYSRCVLVQAVALSPLFRQPIPSQRSFIPAF